MRKFLFIVMGSLIPAVAVIGARGQAPSPKPPCAAPADNYAFMGIKTVRLWEGDAPEARGNQCEDIPTLTIFDPPTPVGNGSAVIVFPGGGYHTLVASREGRQVADWFAARGFKAFILSYRLSANGYLLPVPLLDARRAIQTVRAHAAEYHIDPNRIVVAGFSAGGHLAALSATRPVSGDPSSADPIERVSSRPDYLVVGYPWIGALGDDMDHLNYCKTLNIMDKCAALRAQYSPDLFVTKDDPPTFWVHSIDDKVVPIEQGMRFYLALLKAGVPAEAHLFGHGGHGFALGKGDPELDGWTVHLEAWLRTFGLFTPVVRPKTR